VSDPANGDNEQLQQYAEIIRDLRISHEAGHAVLGERFGYVLEHLSLDVSVVSPEGGTGGTAEIQFRMYHKRSDFPKQLQDIATVLMGGRAAEELAYPHLARDSHWQMDISDFKRRVSEFRGDAEMDALLDEGHRRAKVLLRNTEVSEQHDRLRRFLKTNPLPQRPNGNYLRRVMKGLSP
jgi:ATP-dependent Zn protease